MSIRPSPARRLTDLASAAEGRPRQRKREIDMKAMVLEGGAGLDHLTLQQRPEPKAGPGEVLGRLQAASINYRALATVTMMAPQRPLIPLSDGAGVVEAVGEGVSRVAAGDLVMPGFFPNWVAGR